jgi:hypothetical protein
VDNVKGVFDDMSFAEPSNIAEFGPMSTLSSSSKAEQWVCHAWRQSECLR